MEKNIKIRDSGKLDKHYDNISKQILKRNISEEVFSGVVDTWMYSLHLCQFFTSPLVIDEIVKERRFHESALHGLLNTAELLISLKQKKFKEVY